VVALDDALAALKKFDSRKNRLVELRFSGGLTAEEAAEVLGVAVRTVHREWNLARTWLFREIPARMRKDGNRGADAAPCPRIFRSR
jgi:DNA-directed RNA polymerase specialized sigma24 family protein